MPANFYSLPEEADQAYRSSAEACPTSYKCENGLRELNFVFTDCKERSKPEGVSGDVGSPVSAVILDGDAITYSLGSPTRGSGCTWGTAPTLSIGATTGQITMSSNTLDHEQCDSITVVTTATSGEHTITCTTTIAITNVNEAPTLINCGTDREVTEMSAVNTEIGSPISASDPDLGESLFYSITAGVGKEKFSIGLCTGQLTVADPAIAYTDGTSYTLTIKVVDDEPSGALSDTCTVTVQVRCSGSPSCCTH